MTVWATITSAPKPRLNSNLTPSPDAPPPDRHPFLNPKPDAQRLLGSVKWFNKSSCLRGLTPGPFFPLFQSGVNKAKLARQTHSCLPPTLAAATSDVTVGPCAAQPSDGIIVLKDCGKQFPAPSWRGQNKALQCHITHWSFLPNIQQEEMFSKCAATGTKNKTHRFWGIYERRGGKFDASFLVFAQSFHQLRHYLHWLVTLPGFTSFANKWIQRLKVSGCRCVEKKKLTM